MDIVQEVEKMVNRITGIAGGYADTVKTGLAVVGAVALALKVKKLVLGD